MSIRMRTAIVVRTAWAHLQVSKWLATSGAKSFVTLFN